MGSVGIGLGAAKLAFRGRLALWGKRIGSGGTAIHGGLGHERAGGGAPLSASAPPPVSRFEDDLGNGVSFIAFRRALARKPALAPAGESYADFLAWRAKVGSQPAGDDDLRSEYEDLCELLGRAPEALAVSDLPLPPAPVGLASSACLPTLATSNGKHVGTEAATPGEAAREFRDWLMEHKHFGEFSSEMLSALYLEHCTLLRRQPTPENMMREALAHLGRGVTRQQVNSQVNGKRHRSMVWSVKPITTNKSRRNTERAHRRAA